MARSVALTHLVRQADGTSQGVWAGHELRSAFQPIFSFVGDKLEPVAQEGLLRAFRDGEPIAPINFFASIPVMDRLHVETLTRTLHLLNAAACLDDQQAVFVNFNPSLFTERAVADIALRDMRLVLHEAEIDPRRVVCEVTEQRSASAETLLVFIDALRGSGFRIAVDDYGAADSDIMRVTELRPDIVKFDAHWMTRMMETSQGYSVLATLVKTFEDRGIQTVFEGIEDEWQIDLAHRAGVSMLQGYALARPQLAVPRMAPVAIEDEIPILPVLPDEDFELAQPAPARATRSERTFGKRVSAV